MDRNGQIATTRAALEADLFVVLPPNIPDMRRQHALISAARYRLLERLAAAHADNPAARYLHATRGFDALRSGWKGSIPPERGSEVAALLPHLAAVPGAADVLADDLLGFADWATQTGDFDIATAIGETLRQHCRDPLHRYRADRVQQRLAFERRATTPTD